ncbi:hypothetical protein Rhopal_002669-T1 [Rhodotorula paludigena]|uniref:1-phosphatidylinositol-3-phosphate 5-kinase n=1 Tax=Rhodotorula paludigena TaxID=86838 RepID=A0AAV5GJX4_9BASI|nr:hypothetical protein Rhopal_002669-T1 [Rhodotorula paludigena]
MSASLPAADTYESFPFVPPSESPHEPAEAETGPLARLRRFLVGGAGSSQSAQPGAGPSAAPPAGSAGPRDPSPLSDARFSSAKQALESALGGGGAGALSALPPGSSARRGRSRDPSSSRTGADASRDGTGSPGGAGRRRGGAHSSRPGDGQAADEHAQQAGHPTLPNGQRFVRPLRLSGAPPSVRVSLQNAETSGILSSSVGAAAGSDYRFPLAGDAIAPPHDSPTLSEGFPGATPWPTGSSDAGAEPRKRRLSITKLASFSGFSRPRVQSSAADDDARSVWSVGTGHKATPTAYEMMRRLRGEGLSKTYWIKDESAKDCFQCQAVFTTFRRKHHSHTASYSASNILPRFGQLERVRVCDGCFPTALKHESSRTSLDDSASLHRYRPAGHDVPSTPSQSRFIRPTSLYQRHSRLSTSASLPDIDDDRLSRASSRPQSPIFEEGERDPPELPSRPHSPKSSIMHKQQLEAAQAAAKSASAASATSPGMGGVSGGDGDVASESASAVAGLQSPALSAAAPFRRELGDEEHETADEGDEDERHGKNASGVVVQGLGLDLDGNEDHIGASEAQQQGSSPASAARLHAGDSPFPRKLDRANSRVSGLLVPSLPLEPFDPNGINPDVYHEDAFRAIEAPDIPLSPAALAHIRRMIRQSLEREGVPQPEAWEPELERLLFDVADRLSTLEDTDVGNFEVHEHVRVKRIPGGRPRDSEFVNGVVFTKNLMQKKMPRQLSNPKIMLVSFPLDFQRADGKYLDLDTVLRQEKEHLQNVVARIQNHFPQIVLVERNVSSRALEYLLERDVAVARNVKHEALVAVSRSFGAEIIESANALLDNKVGRCTRFRVQTFVHPLIPGKRKTFLRFEGGDKQTGCTVLLRGGAMDTLTKVKRIVNMLVLVVYSAKLEGYLLHDQRIEVLPTPPLATADVHLSPIPPPVITVEEQSGDNEKASADDSIATEKHPLVVDATTSQRISHTLEPYQATALSGSALVHYPPPYPLARMAEEDLRIRDLRQQRDLEEAQRILAEETASRAVSISAGSSQISLDELGSEASFGSVDALPSPLGSVTSEAAFPLPARERDFLQKPEDLARQTKFVEAEEEHAQHLVAWEAYHKAHVDSFDPRDFQQLFVLESLVQVNQAGEPVRLCRPPEVHSISFYREGDTTIGQYLKNADSALRSNEPCPSPSCHEPLHKHQRIFVHGAHVLRVEWESWSNDVLDESIGMSAECRHAGCRCAGRLTRASIETTRLSLGKFLELSFYPSARIACADDSCGHDGQLEHVRYWHFSGIRVAIRMDRIDLRDIVPPPRNVRVKPDRQLELRNAEYEQVLRRSEAFFASVQARVAAFKYDCIPVDRVEECKTALGDFATRCENDRKAISRLLRATYERAHESNGTEMTVVRRALQEKSHAFDADWAAFVKRVMPADLPDMRRASASQLKRIFPDAGIALSPTSSRSASGMLPPALEEDEHGEDGVQHTAERQGNDDGLPTVAEDEAQIVRDADIQIEPQDDHALDPLAASTSTVVPGAPSTVRPPPLSRSATISSQRSSFDSDLDSDSTVCADGEPTTVVPRTSSPFIKRRGQLQAPADETSAAESEREPPIWQRRKAGQVASLVSAFNANGTAPSLSRHGTYKPKQPSDSPARPGLRRSQTDKTPSTSKIRPRPGTVLSDNDGSYARNVGVSHLADKPSWTAAPRPSRIPSRKPVKSHSGDQPAGPLSDGPATSTAFSASLGLSVSPTATRPSSRASSRAPSSRAPSRPVSPTAMRSRGLLAGRPGADGPAIRPPLKTASSSRSTIKAKSRETGAASESSDVGGTSQKVSRGLGVTRSPASSASKVATRRVVSTGTGRHVTNMRRHWDGLAQAAEKRQAMRKRARPIITSQPTVQIFENIRDAILEDSDDDGVDSSSSSGESGGADDEFDDEQEPPEREDDGNVVVRSSPGKATVLHKPESDQQLGSAPLIVSSMADALARSNNGSQAPPHERHLDPLDTQLGAIEPSDSDFPSVPASPVMPDSFTFPRMSEGESSGAERRSIFNAFSSLWNYRNGDFSPLAYPTLATEHVYADNPVLLRDDEPTSIIAHALSSRKYFQAFENANLPRIRRGLSGAADEVIDEKVHFATQHHSDISQTIEDILRASTQRSFKLGDVELGDISARCTVFWVEQFEALRRQCGCDKQFIESLSRCMKWDAVGGKSKVDFMKTLDDRFIVKQLSRPEMEVFARFAPAYFQYMADALFQGRPTVLAKVFGIYRISLGKHYRNVDFLVMENLFYGRQLRQIFDLKGSTRNRRAEENNPNPLYVREESKQFIKQAIYNDSQFLSDLNVMDYSLVVGVDAVRAELVVGIVDYIRTFTWDKRIESWVKETTFLGGTSKAGGPTVITPKQYRQRFREAIDGYLLLCPTPWLDPKSLLPVPEPPAKPDAPFESGTEANPPVPASSHPAPPPSDTSSFIAASLATM